MKIYLGISFSKILVEVKTVLCKDNSSTKTYTLPKHFSSEERIEGNQDNSLCIFHSGTTVLHGGE